MGDQLTGRQPPAILDRSGYELEVEDRFDRPLLDEALWIPYYLPHWGSRAACAARYTVGEGTLRLLIESDQEPWSPELNGHLRAPSEARSASTTFKRALSFGKPNATSRYILRDTVCSSFEPARLATPRTWLLFG